MTLANSATPTTITLVLRDINRREVKKTFIVPTGVWDPTTGLIADLKTIRDNLVTAYNAVTTALIYRSFITLGQEDDTAIAGPAGSTLTEAASVVCEIDSAGFETATIIIPSPDDDNFVSTTGKNRNVVDPNDTDLLAFIEFFTTTDGKFTLSDGETLVDTDIIKSGKRIPHKVKAPLPSA